ncbi:MAG: isoprenylcysteine carboxylmethyltransferase family protein [Candidatus Aminicenantes bacterium]|nr:MAG: isoprenylcysteine carboxylmethyltransferase family protein [Candidatus Aminicenantes bacterium]
MSQSKAQSKTKIIIRTIVTVLFAIVVVFVPAGTFNWPEAWIFLLLYFVSVTAVLIWMKKNIPGLLKERMSKKKEIKSWDKKFFAAYSFFLIILLIVPGLDAVRFGWSEVPLFVKALGFIGFIPAMGFAFWAVKENAYASDTVRIQKERGHTVCTTGPYRYVRHPMYVGVILFLFCLPLFLGSLYTFIPAFINIALFIMRTSLEDKALQEELTGYKEYAQKVRYRLFPGIW